MKQNFSVLDGMRGIAAIFVLILHTGSYWRNVDFYHSYLAVDLFFVLSGFVIAHAYENKLANHSLSVKKFILTRLIRLYPMYFLSIVLVVILLIMNYPAKFNPQTNISNLMTSIGLTVLFLPSVLPANIYLFPLNTPYWSVFYELIINFLYAIARPVLKNNMLYIILPILALLLMVMAYLHGGVGAGVTWRYTSIASALTRSGFGILYGVLLYRVGNQYFSGLILPAWALIAVIATVLMAPNLGFFNGLFDLFALFFVFPACVILGTRCKVNAVSNPLSFKIFTILGSASYPMYLMHMPISGIGYYFYGDAVEKYAPLSGGVLLILLITFVLIIEKYIDIPIRKYLVSKYVK